MYPSLNPSRLSPKTWSAVYEKRFHILSTKTLEKCQNYRAYQAIFGRPEPLRDMLKSPPPPQIGRGFGRVRGGGTEAAAQHLADALSVFDRDVEAAGMLVEDGASLRCVIRLLPWAWKPIDIFFPGVCNTSTYLVLTGSWKKNHIWIAENVHFRDHG